MGGRTNVVLLALITAVLAAGLVSAAAVGERARAVTPGAGETGVQAADPAPAEAVPSASPPDVTPYHGLGAWVDAFDYAPAYHRPREGPQLVADDLDAMAARGVRTLYLQAARPDELSPAGIVDRELVGRFLVRAHQLGMQVVAWYLPKFGDLEADLRNLALLREFRAQGRGFDGIAVDIEYRRDVPDHAERNRRVIELSQRLRADSPGVALGAIVYPPVLLDVISPGFWPGFPWRELASAYDVWMPMAYWTEVRAASPYRHDAFRYAVEGTQGVRGALDDPSALVHVIGGVAGDGSVADVEGFARGARETNAVGWSVYDYRTTTGPQWDVLR